MRGQEKNRRRLNGRDMPRLKVLTLFWGLSVVTAFGLNQQDVTVTLTSGNYLIIDAQDPCNSASKAAYVSFEICNQTNRTLNNITSNFSGLATGFSLAGGQASQQQNGSLAPGECMGIYWYITYPCIPSALTFFDLQLRDDQPGAVSFRQAARVTSILRSSSGGNVLNTDAGPIPGILNTTYLEVLYSFGNLGWNGLVHIQPAGNTNFDAGCYQLTDVEVLSSDMPTVIPVGPVNQLTFSNNRPLGSNANQVRVRYTFQQKCPFSLSEVWSYGFSSSGGQFKLSPKTQTAQPFPDPLRASCGTLIPDQFAAPVAGLASGLTTTADHRALAWGDYDNDGAIDLFISTYAPDQPNLLYRNNGNGTFSVAPGGPITTDLASSLAATWGDYDNDGDLDLFVANNVGSPNFLYRNNGSGSFDRIQDDPIVNDLGYAHGASWVDYDRDGWLDLFTTDFFPTGFNRLYHNNGDGTFSDVINTVITQEAASSVSAAWGDYDLDGWPDLFVANTNGENNSLYHNLGGGQFEKISSGAMVQDGGRSVGASWGDYDNDGDLDLFVANAGDEDNFLYRNDGNGTFTRISNAATQDGGHTHGSLWLDYDLDGDLDLLAINNQGQEHFLYRNDGGGNFVRVSNALTQQAGDYMAVTAADIDNDGDQDILLANHNGGNPALFESTMAPCQSSLSLQLEGSNSNQTGIGTMVTVSAVIQGNRVRQTRYLGGQSGGGIGAQSDTKLFFGLGNAPQIDSIIINWPSGMQQTLTNQAPGPYLLVREPAGALVSGTAFIDLNNNCVQDNGELPLPYASLIIQPGNHQVFADANGDFATYLSFGTFAVSGTAFNNWNTGCAAQSFTINNIFRSVTGLAIGFQSGCNNSDLQISMAKTANRVGFKSITTVTATNTGSRPAMDVRLNVDFGVDITPLSSSLTWSTATGTIRGWQLPDLLPGQSVQVIIADSIHASAVIGQIISLTGSLSTSSLDCNSANNIARFSGEAIGAIDPNDLLVDRDGAIEESDFLEYRIRFQNVGNDLASRVVLEMPLPEVFDMASLELGVASHPYRFSIEGEHKLIWEFPNINLPDSTTNEPASHGYAVLRIKVRPGLAPGTPISNRAYIYFDQHFPIATNITSNFVANKSLNINNGLQLLVYPNPSRSFVNFEIASGEWNAKGQPEMDWIRVMDWSGRVILDQAVSPVSRLEWTSLPVSSGIYLVSARAENKWYTGKWLVVD